MWKNVIMAVQSVGCIGFSSLVTVCVDKIFQKNVPLPETMHSSFIINLKIYLSGVIESRTVEQQIIKHIPF